jgi:hypothetical protein
MATDLDAMPDPCSAGAPYFSGQPNEFLAAFLQEFDALATSHRLTDGQKVRTILEYVLPSIRDWQTFRTTSNLCTPAPSHVTQCQT